MERGQVINLQAVRQNVGAQGVEGKGGIRLCTQVAACTQPSSTCNEGRVVTALYSSTPGLSALQT